MQKQYSIFSEGFTETMSTEIFFSEWFTEIQDIGIYFQ